MWWQACVHAPIHAIVVSFVPDELEGLEVDLDGETIVLHTCNYMLVTMALYGYRRSLCPWQDFSVKVITQRSRPVCCGN